MRHMIRFELPESHACFLFVEPHLLQHSYSHAIVFLLPHSCPPSQEHLTSPTSFSSKHNAKGHRYSVTGILRACSNWIY